MKPRLHLQDDSKKTIRVVISAFFVLAVVCFIFYNSLQGSEESNQRSGIIMKLLRSILDPNHVIPEAPFHWGVRKLAHFSEFALLGISLYVLFLSIRSKFQTWDPGMMLFAALAIAVADEYIQSFTGRTSSVKDVLIDFGGAVFGTFLMWLLDKMKREHHRTHQ